jgi:hypothetical protein
MGKVIEEIDHEPDPRSTLAVESSHLPPTGFNRVFHIEGWADVVLASNYVAFIFFLFWFGILDALRKPRS